MSTMPKKIDDELKARAVRLVQDHRGEYSSLTAAAAVVAKQLGVGKESVRRWAIQAEIDGGRRQGPTSEELAEIKALKAENRRLREDVEILRGATTFFASMPSWVLPGGVRSFLCCLGSRWLVLDVRLRRAPRARGSVA
jgi:transposase